MSKTADQSQHSDSKQHRVEILETNLEVKEQLLVAIDEKYKQACEENVALERKVKTLEKEKEEALSRLSKLAGKKITDGNPNITDFDNSNRPSKIGERWNSLYTDEWKDAYDELKSKTDHCDITIEQRLLETVDWCYKKCSTLADSQFDQVRTLIETIVSHLNVRDPPYNTANDVLTKTNCNNTSLSTDVDFDMSVVSKEATTLSNDAARHKISLIHKLPKRRPPGKFKNKNYTKENDIKGSQLTETGYLREQMDSFLENFTTQRRNNQVVENVVKKCVADYKSLYPKVNEKEMKFVEKCSELCWFMVIADPSMVLEFQNLQGKTMDKNKFNKLSGSGKTIDFVVWPVLLLHKDGPVLAKGTVQPNTSGNKQKLKSK